MDKDKKQLIEDLKNNPDVSLLSADLRSGFKKETYKCDKKNFLTYCDYTKLVTNPTYAGYLKYKNRIELLGKPPIRY